MGTLPAAGSSLARRVRLSCAVALLALLGPDPAGSQAPAPTPAPPVDAAAGFSSSAEPILSAIESLESDRDATCHSSASRFEDFLFGTPLSEEGRQEKTELQKALVRRLWAEASRAAARSGDTQVAPRHLQPAIDAVYELTRTDDAEIGVLFAGGQELTLPKRGKGQYSRIGYALRAILAVQQDYLLTGGDPLVTLSPEAIELLKECVDVVAVSALLRADQRARERSEFRIGARALRDAWQGLVATPPSEPQSARASRPTGTGNRAETLALLEELFDGKSAAYRVYNEVDPATAHALFVTNIHRFYARAPLTRIREDRLKVVAALTRALDAFAVALLVEADGRAHQAGHEVIRAVDAEAAVQALLPYEIDEFEDVHLFPRLPEGDRFTLEAYECDSFRDFGVHWQSLKSAVREVSEETALPDPFAAEILAEAISQYGVALLRVSGELAIQSNDNVYFMAEDITPGAIELRERAERHRRAPPVPQVMSHIVSSSGDLPEATSTTYFSDVTAEAGIAFVHRSSRWLGDFRQTLLQTPPTFSGGGVASGDVDGDSHPDLLFVGGGGNALLLGDGAGHFSDVTERVGLDLVRPDGSFGEPRMPIIADFDNDGLQDILITYVDDDRKLYRNLGGLRFADVSAQSGLGGKGLISGAATAFDFDQDGLLDLYVTNFGDYLHGGIPSLDRDNRNAQPNQLFRNVGGMRFEDVTEGSGTADTGWAQAVSHVDFDRDGWQDLIVANDYGRNAFLRNLGNGRFENVAPDLGVTKAFHSMNVGFSDLNDDGYPDVYISNLATLVKDNKYTFPDVNTPMNFDLRAMAGMLVKESDMLYMSRAEGGRLVDYSPSTDVERGTTSTGWAWDAEFFDFDHDGDDDLYLVNGTNDYNAFFMVYGRPDDGGQVEQLLLNHSRESNVFFLNQGGKLKNVSDRSGADFVGNSRSTAYLDFDGDGDLDIAINNFHGPAKLFRNNNATGGHWLKLELVGDPQRATNRDAIGARVLVSAADGLHVLREIHGGSGYLSMNPKQLHFGLGSAVSVNLQIVWPNGERQDLAGVAANRSYRLRQGGGLEPAGETAAPAASASPGSGS